jgi:hypothetical protein
MVRARAGPVDDSMVVLARRRMVRPRNAIGRPRLFAIRSRVLT